MKKKTELDYSSDKILKKINKIKKENKEFRLREERKFLEENKPEEDDEDIIIKMCCYSKDDDRDNVTDFAQVKEYKEKLEKCKEKIKSQSFSYDEFEERVVQIRDYKRYEALIKKRERKIKEEAQKLRDEEDREIYESRRQRILEKGKRERPDRVRGTKSVCGSGVIILVKIALILYVIMGIPFFGNFLIAIGVNAFASLIITLFLVMFVIAFIIIIH